MSQKLFNQIAKKYECGNAVISLGLYSYWNRKLTHALKGRGYLLDLCAGSGKVAAAFLRKNPASKALLLDFSEAMLQLANDRASSFRDGQYKTLLANAQSLPLDDHSFDAISLAYGIRNIENPERCIQEAYRVLKPKGIFVILELTRPSNALLAALHRLYLKKMLPAMGGLLVKDRAPYEYLANSVLAFDAKKIEEVLIEKGFSGIKVLPLTFGIVTLITARK